MSTTSAEPQESQVPATLTKLDFVKKVIPNVTFDEIARSWTSMEAWVPSFTYTYTYGGKNFTASWSPSPEHISGDAYELVAAFGNTSAPTEKFSEYWESRTQSEPVNAIVLKSDPSTSRLDLGQLSAKESFALEAIGIGISIIVIAIFCYNMFFRGS